MKPIIDQVRSNIIKSLSNATEVHVGWLVASAKNLTIIIKKKSNERKMQVAS